MEKPNSERKTVFATPWFQVLESAIAEQEFPNYAIQSVDFVIVMAVTAQKELLLVRQFRHAIAEETLELPAGHVEQGETPEQAARKELLEETGHVAEKFELLASLSPSTSRFTNRMWCYFAPDAKLADGVEIEPGLSCIYWSKDVQTLLQEPDFYSSGSWAALLAAVAQGKLKI